MNFVLFYHSLVSDWNHGNAHFLRGVASDLVARGHRVTVYEPRDGWSRTHLLREHGDEPLQAFQRRFPLLSSRLRHAGTDLRKAVGDADVVLVHEWNEPELLSSLEEIRNEGGGGFRLLFHDTHHRMITDPGIAMPHPTRWDGVLAFGRSLAREYRRRGWGSRVWTWHEAADMRVFTPQASPEGRRDLIWIGNWGDDERAAELREYLIRPVKALGLDACVRGVRYPVEALESLQEAGIEYGGWIPNHEVPRLFAGFRVTLHIPRRPYVRDLPGIPTIRPFEALACGIPLISAPWPDEEGLFRQGEDYLVARDAIHMAHQIRRVLTDPALARRLARSGLETIRNRHTCAHRVDQLVALVGELGPAREREVVHHA
jgi:spore maturation protein CgeB